MKRNVRKGGGEHQSSSERDNDDKNGDDDDDDLFATEDAGVKDNIETVVKTEVKHKILVRMMMAMVLIGLTGTLYWRKRVES